MPRPLRIGGIARLSTCDWPGQLVATVFCRGCPWACRYCHNTHLLKAGEDGATADVPWVDVLGFLYGRRGLLDGVVFSGGEPLLQEGLVHAMREARRLGFAIGLHTGGAYPDRFAEALTLVDWVGFDVKAPFDRYEAVTGRPGSGAKARASLERLIASGVAFEVRTTLHPALLADEDVLRLADELSGLGVTDYALQSFRPQGCADADLLREAAPIDPALPQRVAQRFPRFEFRAN
jgi:pyruvate formate lyase activating enzyme